MGREWITRMDDDGGEENLTAVTVGSVSPSRLLPVSSRSSDGDAACDDGGAAFIIHTVSKFDTLAGVAIKYGVEVADIKKLNGLVTDLQMFALKTLRIPLPGRHTPSTCLSNGSEIPSRPNTSQQTRSRQRRPDLFDAFPSLKLKSSSAAVNLHGYYRSSPAERDGAEGCEMVMCQKDRPLGQSTSISDQSPRKSKSTADFLASMESDELISQEEALRGNTDKSNEKLVRRRQSSVGDLTTLHRHTTQQKVKEENCVNGAAVGVNSMPIGLMDSILTNVVSAVRKSWDSEGGSPLSSVWETARWSLKPDFVALSTVAIARPVFDSLSKPTGPRNKAAVD